jgi:hypothetical protein
MSAANSGACRGSDEPVEWGSAGSDDGWSGCRRWCAGNRALGFAEGLVYLGIAAFLLVLAVGSFVIAAHRVPTPVRW